MDDLPAAPRRVFGLPQERQKAVDILHHCYTNDLLDLAEFESRLALAEHASTLDELELVLADIPAEHRQTGAPTTGGLTETETVNGTMNTKRVADGVLLTKVLVAQANMGNLLLDYRDLPLPAGVLEVRLKVSLSNCVIHLPPGVRVEVRLQETLSSVHEQKDHTTSPKPTILRLTGEAHLSSISIRRKGRLRLWWDRVRAR